LEGDEDFTLEIPMNRKTFFKRSLAGAAAMTVPLGGVQGARPVVDLGEWDTSSWKQVRALFPFEPGLHYFNTGGLGPPSTPVLEAMRRQAELQARHGENYHGLAEGAREAVAAHVGAEADELAFVRNASEANSIIAGGLDLRRGDEVILDAHAHPGGSFAWLVRQKHEGIRVRIFEPDPHTPEGNLERILALVNKRTRVIQLSHITAPTGILFDVEAVAKAVRERGIWFHIDGAQSAGMIPVDVRAIGCHSFATSGHKWLNAPQGTGFLYIARPHIEEVACVHAGAYSDAGYELPDQFTYNSRVQRHEYGTRDAAQLVGFQTAVALQRAIGMERIARHGKELVDRCREAIREIAGLTLLTPEDPRMYNSILTFRLEGKDSDVIASRMKKEHGIRCRTVKERGLNAVRLSWHVYHEEEADLPRVVTAIRTMARG
jgi:selenocysteine lyase/cysteine desulfurase